MNEQELIQRIERLEDRNRELEEKLNNAIRVAAGVNLTTQEKIESLWNAVQPLQQKYRQQEDEEGYAKQGSRYPGKHPRSCACNRCLGL